MTWAHHSLLEGDRKGMLRGLALTVLLGLCFTSVQAYEYSHAAFHFTGGIYPSTFFMATGFHGFHVIVGTTFLIVCLARAWLGHFKPDHHFGFEAAAWYWHFVDVVWLFLFVCIYWWGRRRRLRGGGRLIAAADRSMGTERERRRRLRRRLAARAALGCRCPRCGKGRLFTGCCSVRPALRRSAASILSAQDAGDGPAVFVILFLGLIVVGLAAFVEIEFSPPIWVHLVLWTPLILGGAVGMLRPLKAGLIALQYRHHLLGGTAAAT